MKHICKKCKRTVITKQQLSLNSIKNYRQSSKYIGRVAWCFHCSAPQTSDDMFDVVYIKDLEEVSNALTNMCQENVDVLNIQRCHPKSCIIHYLPIIPTCARHFLTNKDESFDDDLKCQLSENNKGQQCGQKISVFGYRAQCTGPSALCFFASTLIMTTEKKSRHFALGHAYKGISDILRRKGGHIRKHLCGKRANQGARTVL